MVSQNLIDHFIWLPPFLKKHLSMYSTKDKKTKQSAVNSLRNYKDWKILLTFLEALVKKLQLLAFLSGCHASINEERRRYFKLIPRSCQRSLWYSKPQCPLPRHSLKCISLVWWEIIDSYLFLLLFRILRRNWVEPLKTI